MMVHSFGDVLEAFLSSDEFNCQPGVLLHELHFFACKFIVLVKYMIRNADFSDVVERSGYIESLHSVTIQPQVLSNLYGVVSHIVGMLLGVGISLIEDGDEPSEDSQEEVTRRRIIKRSSYDSDSARASFLVHRY